MGDIKKILLHIGCGDRYHKGFINSDKDNVWPDSGIPKKVDMIMDITARWPYENESIDGIISMVVFQCLTWIDLFYVFKQSYRVLKKGGVMRFGVVLEETNQPLRRFLYGHNIQIFNFELFRSVLIDRIGYKSIKLCNYQETLIPEFKAVDFRQNRGTSFIEVIK